MTTTSWIGAGDRFVTRDGEHWIAIASSDDLNQIVYGLSAKKAEQAKQVTGGVVIQYKDVGAFVEEMPDGRLVSIPVND